MIASLPNRRLELAKEKIEQLQSLVAEVQTESEKVSLAEQRRQESQSSEAGIAAGDDVIDVSELVSLKHMIGDYGEKLSEKKKELDKLVLEHRALIEAEDVMGKMDEDRRGSDHKLTKGFSVFMRKEFVFKAKL